MLCVKSKHPSDVYLKRLYPRGLFCWDGQNYFSRVLKHWPRRNRPINLIRQTQTLANKTRWGYHERCWSWSALSHSHRPKFTAMVSAVDQWDSYHCQLRLRVLVNSCYKFFNVIHCFVLPLRLTLFNELCFLANISTFIAAGGSLSTSNFLPHYLRKCCQKLRLVKSKCWVGYVGYLLVVRNKMNASDFILNCESLARALKSIRKVFTSISLLFGVEFVSSHGTWVPWITFELTLYRPVMPFGKRKNVF